MRKIYALAFALAFCVSGILNAQNTNVNKRNIKALMPTKSMTGLEMAPSERVEISEGTTTKPVSVYHKDGAICETVIGTTTYDLQSNASVQNRLVMTANGMSAGWTYSDAGSLAAPDRGTGYNYYDGANWASFPLARIEADRVGWPSIGVTGSGREFSITHPGFTNIQMTYRDGQGSGAWSELLIPTAVGPGLLWPRATSGGADNNSIHMICVSTPVANGGELYNDMDGAFLYYRSTDQGDTWDVTDVQIPGTTFADGFNGVDGDSYAIAANGDKIAIAVFGDLIDTYVLLSEDNGDTWTKTTLIDFPVDNYALDTGIDLDMDGVADTLDNSDGSGNIIVDLTGKAHVFYGDMRYLDADLGDGNFSYFPFTSGIWYWNEDSSEPVEIIDEIDTDGDPDVLGYDDAALYFVSLTGFVNAAVDASGGIHLAFSSLREDVTNGLQNYRHIYLMSTPDNGATWLGPANVTPELDGDETIECVFPTMAPFVDDRVQLIYQRDFEPGLAVRGDMDPFELNEYVHLDIDPAEVVGILDIPTLEVDLSVFPNPSNGELTLTSDLSKLNYLNLNVVDLMGKSVFKDKITESNYTLDLSGKRAGAYFLILENNGKVKAEKVVIK